MMMIIMVDIIEKRHLCSAAFIFQAYTIHTYSFNPFLATLKRQKQRRQQQLKNASLYPYLTFCS